MGSPFGLDATRKTWALPKALISHYSSFLEARCSTPTFGMPQQPIELTHDDPKVFSLLVEWMLYGTYTTSPNLSADNTLDADAWVLGDKLKVANFQNLAMDHLYRQHNGLFNQKPVTPAAIRHACANTPAGSLLRQFYFDILAQNYTKPEMLKGTIAELDAVLQEYPEARTFLLESLRKDPAQRAFVKSEANYMVKQQVMDK